jgi:hypothetical protein
LGISGLYVCVVTHRGKLGSGTKNPPSFMWGSVNKPNSFKSSHRKRANIKPGTSQIATLTKPIIDIIDKRRVCDSSQKARTILYYPELSIGVSRDRNTCSQAFFLLYSVHEDRCS